MKISIRPNLTPFFTTLITATVDGVVHAHEVQSDARAFPNANIFVCDTRYPCADVSIRNLRITSGYEVDTPTAVDYNFQEDAACQPDDATCIKCKKHCIIGLLHPSKLKNPSKENEIFRRIYFSTKKLNCNFQSQKGKTFGSTAKYLRFEGCNTTEKPYVFKLQYSLPDCYTSAVRFCDFLANFRKNTQY